MSPEFSEKTKKMRDRVDFQLFKIMIAGLTNGSLLSLTDYLSLQSLTHHIKG